MALANVSYTSDGTQTDFVVTFDYLSQDDVQVFVDNVLTTDPLSSNTASFQDATTMRVTLVGGSPLASGSVVKIQRVTPTASPAVVFSDGAVVRAQALNQNTDQLLFIAQEISDLDDSRVGLANDGTFDFQNKRATNLANPVNDQDAATLAHVRDQYNSGIDAGVARDQAQFAQSAAETALSNTEAARDSALGAQSSSQTSAAAALASQNAAATSETNAASSTVDALAHRQAALASEQAASASELASLASQNSASSSATASQNSRLASEAARDLSQAAQAGSEAAQAASETARDAAQAAQANLETNRDAAAASATAASNSASAASTSETNAASSLSSANSAQAAAEAARDAAQAARDVALDSYDQFDDRYLGAKASDPTVDNDGDPLVAGSLFFDTTAGAMKLYTGTGWVAAYVSGSDFAPLTGAVFTGGITVPQVTVSGSGTVDGRDVSADGAKLDTVETAAQVNVNADFTAVSGDAQILNKPTTLSGYGITDAVSSNGGTVNGILTVGGSSVSGSEGGEIQFTKAPNGTLNGNVHIDLLNDNIRFFTAAAGNAGAYIDLTQCQGGVGSQIYHSGSNPQLGYIDTASGEFGTINVDDDRGIDWAGYSIRNEVAFMMDISGNCGIYNDVDNHWHMRSTRGGTTEIHYAGLVKAYTSNTGVGVNGNLVATGNVTAYSDARLKSDVETLDGSLVYQMRGVGYTMGGKRGSGVIAQELQQVAPELVIESEDGKLSVAYGNVVGYLIEAVKDLKKEIQELKGE